MSTQYKLAGGVENYLTLTKDLRNSATFRANYGPKNIQSAAYLKKYKNVHRENILLYLYQIEIHTQDLNREKLIATLQEFFLQAEEDKTEEKQLELDLYQFLKDRNKLKPDAEQPKIALDECFDQLKDLNFKYLLQDSCFNHLDDTQKAALKENIQADLTPKAIIQRKAQAIDATHALGDSNADLMQRFTENHTAKVNSLALTPDTINKINDRLNDYEHDTAFSYRKDCSHTSKYCLLETLVNFYESINANVEQSMDEMLDDIQFTDVYTGIHGFATKLVSAVQSIDQALDEVSNSFDLDVSRNRLPTPKPRGF